MAQDEPMPERLNMMDTEGEDTWSHLAILVNDADELVMEGHDMGPAVEDIFGEDDYEYRVTVQREHKDWLLLNLIKGVFADHPKPSSSYMEWLKEQGIPYDFSSY